VDPETTQREDSKLKQKTKRNKKIRRQAVPRATRGDTTPTFKKFHETPNETKTSYTTNDDQASPRPHPSSREITRSSHFTTSHTSQLVIQTKHGRPKESFPTKNEVYYKVLPTHMYLGAKMLALY
jgi:hypothetical protein